MRAGFSTLPRQPSTWAVCFSLLNISHIPFYSLLFPAQPSFSTGGTKNFAAIEKIPRPRSEKMVAGKEGAKEKDPSVGPLYSTTESSIFPRMYVRKSCLNSCITYGSY